MDSGETTAFKRIERREGLAARIYQEIERMILSGRLAPGTRLNEYNLAKQFDVSRGPVREATRALVEAGLLVSVPAYGVYVREMSEAEIAEYYDVRSLLTGLLCACAAERRTDKEIRVLERLIRDMDEAAASNKVAQYYEKNLAFHELIGRIANHSCGHRLYNGLIRETHFLRQSTFSPDQTISEHRAIVEAIRNQDSRLARKLGEEHVLHGKQRWLESLKSGSRQIA